LEHALRKVPIDPDKRSWHPSVLPGQVVLISTMDQQGQANVAPKSWITMGAFDPPVILFGCNLQHATYRNVLETGCFVVNIPDETLAPRVWSMLDHHGAARVEASALTLSSAHRVSAPLIDECSAHIECTLLDTHAFGEEVLVFGRVVAASIDAVCLEGSPAEQYRRLRPVFFLENGWYAPIGEPRRVAAR
jgi:flavin reductase (DIM6/NTAB) family NADH-FMN oxidoreductase RutF